MGSFDSNRICFSEVEDRLTGILQEFASRPIPEQKMLNAGAYKKIEIDETQSKTDKLVNVNAFGISSIAFYRDEAINNPTYGMNIDGAPKNVYLRESVCQRLQMVNEILASADLELVCYDGHRSISTQKKLWNSFIKKANEQGLFGKAAEDFAINYCSNPSSFNKKDPTTWPIHSTGGAVDIYLRDKRSGKVIDLGEEYFDNPNEVTHTNFYEKKSKTGPLSAKEKSALKARRILYHAMNEIGGFVNFPYECFHYDFKDQFWGLVKNKTASFAYRDSPEDIAQMMMRNSFQKQ